MIGGIVQLGGIIDAGEAAAGSAMRAAGATHADEAAEVTAEAVAHAPGADGGPMQVAVRHAGRADARAGADALNTRIDQLVEQPAATLTADDWETFKSALAADPTGSTLIGPRTAFGAPDLRLVVDQVLLGHEDSLATAERYFGAWRVARTGPEAMAEQTHALMTRWPGDLSPEDWKTLRGLADADPTGAITHVPEQTERAYAGLRQSIVDFADRGGTVDERQIAQFKRWVRDNDPAYPAKWKDAVDAAATGKKLTWDQFYTLRLEAEHFEELGPRLAHLTPTQRHDVLFYVADRNRYALAGWMQRHDAEYEPMLRATLDKIVDGTELNALESAVLSTGKERIDELVAGRPLAEQRTIVDRMLSGTPRNDWMRAHVPNWEDEVNDALDRVIELRATGEYDWKATGLLRDEGEHLDPILAKRPYEQQLAYRNGSMREEQLIPWMQANDPHWDETVARTLADTLAGGTPEHGEAILRTQSDRIDELVAGKPFEEQSRIAQAVLHRNDFYEWNLANNPENRVKVDAAVQRIIDGKPKEEGDGLIFVQETDRIDQLTAGHPYDVQEKIARGVLGEQSLWFARWLDRNQPNRAQVLRDAADRIIADSGTREDFAALVNLQDGVTRVLDGRPIPDQLRILRGIRRGDTRDALRQAMEPKLLELQQQAAKDAELGELTDDARVVLRGEYSRVDQLTEGRSYEAKLRIADAILDDHGFQKFKAAADPDRVAHVRASVTALADGAGTIHDERVLRGERDVLGLVRGRPYAEQLRVASKALDAGSLEFWKRANDPEYTVRLSKAIDDIVAGNLSTESVDMVTRDRTNVFKLLAERTPQEQARVAFSMLGRDGVSFGGELGAMRTLALDARKRLDALPDVGELSGMRAETSEMLDRNIGRMSGFNVGDPNAGYSNHPDYAEMGRVQANVELLEAVAKGRTSTASAQEVLSW